MKRLIITSTDSGAGGVKASRIADKVIALGHSLVHGPAPAASTPAEFFSARAALVDAECEDWEKELCDRIALVWQQIEESGNQFDRIEVWADPNCNAQLQLIQLLDWAHSAPEIAAKLALVHCDSNVGELTPESIASLKVNFQSATDDVLHSATLAWRAYLQPTPEAWSSLLGAPLEPLPYLRSAVVRLLQELPALETALRRTELELMHIIFSGESGPMRVLGKHVAADEPPVFGYWELGPMLEGLARCRRPVVLGLAEGPFTLSMHDSKARLERYKKSTLSLSELGEALLDGKEDFSRHNTIDRWWGGTKLTNARLWRWDDANRKLVPPT